MEKSNNVKIINIAVAYDRNVIYGLGDDGMVYIWMADKHIWQIWG